jgi:putative flippase GtrA
VDRLAHTAWSVVRRHLSREVSAFLLVGGLGYVTDVAAFNVLLSTSPFDRWDPSVARVAAVAVAMVVTYCGNRWLTWRGVSEQTRAREVSLFVVFNLIGLGISTVTLVLSHDVLGLTSRLDDNLSANGLGLALGTLFRFWSYRRFVFGVLPEPESPRVPVAAGVRAQHPQL